MLRYIICVIIYHIIVYYNYIVLLYLASFWFSFVKQVLIACVCLCHAMCILMYLVYAIIIVLLGPGLVLAALGRVDRLRGPLELLARCMYIYIYIYVYTHIHTYTHIYIYTSSSGHIYIYIYRDIIYIYIYIYIYVCRERERERERETEIHTYIHMSLSLSLYIYIYIYIYTYPLELLARALEEPLPQDGAHLGGRFEKRLLQERKEASLVN